MRTEPELLNERLDRLATVLDEIMPNCALLVRDALELLKEQEAEIEHMKRPDCEHAEHDGIGCLGYCGCTQDDEPIESCKRCEKYTGNVYEAVKWE